MSTTIAAPSPVAATSSHRAALRRPRASVWPYAGLVSAGSAFASVILLSQGSAQFDLKTHPTSNFVIQHLHSAAWIKVGGGVAMLSVVAGMIFLIGLGRFIEALAPARRTVHAALRMSTTAFVATASIGVMMRYIVAGGAKGGIDKNLYTQEAVSTLSSLGDQLACASALPVLMTMGLVGFVVVRDRLLTRAAGAAALLLAATSTTATLALGLPYSSYLVYPLFAAIIGLNGIASRRAV